MKKFGSYKTLKKHDNENTFEVELIEDIDISNILNISNISEYYDLDEEVADKHDYPKKKIEEIEKILDTRISKNTNEITTKNI